MKHLYTCTMCSSDYNIQSLWISSCLSNFSHSKRVFKVDSVNYGIHYILSLDYARKLKFSSNVQLASLNKLYQYSYACVILHSLGEVYFFKARPYNMQRH